MYHKIFPFRKNAALASCAPRRHFLKSFAFALLIGNAAAGLACRLAGSLALAASAVLCTVAQVARFKRFDMFHTVTPPFEICYKDYTTFF